MPIKPTLASLRVFVCPWLSASAPEKLLDEFATPGFLYPTDNSNLMIQVRFARDRENTFTGTRLRLSDSKNDSWNPRE